ncbi:hypothetical protein [Luminiphilus sp. nBUS_07]|uniref:hypothetical protein n=1 Tax=Luminiphilus sp. nBUS_07 TaxID=3395314 RepID=UPI003EBF6D42
MTQAEQVRRQTFVLFDLTPLLLSRLPEKLSQAIGSVANCGLLSTEDAGYWSLLNGEGWEGVDGLVVFGHRVPDLCIASTAAQNNVPVYYVQHGLFKERLERNIFSLVGLLKLKAGYYLRSYFKCKGRYPHIFTWRALLTLVKSAFVSNKYVSVFLQNSHTEINTAYVYDDAQVDLYRTILGEAVNDYLTVGYLDSGRMDNSCPPEKSATFICQSLVEDGRISEKAYKTALKSALELLERDGWSVQLFLHQRSNRLLYVRLGLEQQIGDNVWQLPSSELYLTDYSTLILEPFSKGRKVARLALSGHQPMDGLLQVPMYPEYVAGWAEHHEKDPFSAIANNMLTL